MGRMGLGLFPVCSLFSRGKNLETWLATLLLCLIFLLALRLETSSGLRPWLGFGLLAGLAALTCPAIVAVLPFLGGWICYRRQHRGRAWLRPAAVAALACIVFVSPWFIRNYRAFHRFIPFRDNMGLVLRLGTKGATTHWAPYDLGPWHNEAEWDQFRNLGELAYMEKERKQAFEFIGAHPGWYAWTSLRRAVYMWTGFWSLDPRYLAQEPLDPPNIILCTALTALALLGLWRAFRKNSAIAVIYALVLVSFPAIYYITSPEVYYRRPIDPFLVILAASLVSARKVQRAQREEKEEFEARENRDRTG